MKSEILKHAAFPLTIEAIVVFFGIIEHKLWLDILGIACAIFVLIVTKRRLDKVKKIEVKIETVVKI
jgi:hypothetical protein